MSVSSMNSGALPRRRTFDPGSIGAIVLVIVVGIGIAGGIAAGTEDAATEPTPAVVIPAQDTFTREREQTRAPMPTHVTEGTLADHRPEPVAPGLE